MHVRFELETLPKLFMRRRHVMILVQNHEGKLLLGRKNHYPDGISRMVGGGVEGDEPLPVAASREFEEELQLGLPPERFIPIAELELELVVHNVITHFTQGLFAVTLEVAEEAVIQASDDLDDLAWMTLPELGELVQRFYLLSGERQHLTGGETWNDYGKVVGKIHQVVYEWCLENET